MECRTSLYEWEMVGIIHALNIWKHYVRGNKFVLRMDHASLTHFLNQPYFNAKQARWLEMLQTYDMEIQHIPGWKNRVADALSRMEDLR